MKKEFTVEEHIYCDDCKSTSTSIYSKEDFDLYLYKINTLADEGIISMEIYESIDNNNYYIVKVYL